ncbi:uncharacterized protein MELLADRAFT_88882 [Melampsora larici-populina 98AG31]|uniref:Uncharacterized protein n=1 Tax=Melampsora larici-populina (strain 98AG31 / pathotype 3-4-7) TaxID=747676 RepID=F4R656_MELLP|nr:uncharacterized protein MELLADRAFT_88882 [Melampsora larici-populina 98AG31]EGG12528.1 hypothetical protein MELLADRAFT_88882 [Melampsora larici-populina 98AG31]
MTIQKKYQLSSTSSTNQSIKQVQTTNSLKPGFSTGGSFQALAVESIESDSESDSQTTPIIPSHRTPSTAISTSTKKGRAKQRARDRAVNQLVPLLYLIQLNSGTIPVLIRSFIHLFSPEELQLIKTGLIVFNSNGKIFGIEKETLTNQEWNLKSDVIRLLKRNWIQKKKLIDRDSEKWRDSFAWFYRYSYSFLDAVQYTNVGVGQQYELLDWLKNVTFLEETKYSYNIYSQRIFEKVVKRLLNSGTTACCYFTLIHLSASKVSSQVCVAAGQRAFIEKGNMDRNETFESFKENSVEDSIKDHEIGILSCIRDGMIATKALVLLIKNLFYLATLGGARVCNLEEQIGNFVVGKEFDGIIVHTGVSFDAIGKVEDDELI